LLTFHRVETREDLKETYRLRYQVYCRERGYEAEEECPQKYEVDEYDAYSVHFIAKKRGKAVGTVRLILNNPIGFPAEKYCKASINAYGMKKEKTVEISRFAISKEKATALHCDRRKIIMGLFREIYQESKKIGVDYFCAAMGEGLQRLLSKYGVIFFRVGQLVDYHGMRALHIALIRNLESDAIVRNRPLFLFVSASVPAGRPKLLMYCSPT
jgi:N-acyl-L-homoserine lactone synthetase